MSLLALMAAALIAGEAPATTAPTVTPVEVDAPKEEVVCRRERATGSNRMEKVCRTKTQVQAERDTREKRFGPGLSAADRGRLTFKPVVGRE